MVYGSYEALQAGSIGEGLRLLSGSPCETIHLNGGLGLDHAPRPHTPPAFRQLSPSLIAESSHSSLRATAANDVWAHIATAHFMGQLIGASSSSDTGSTGIVPMHAFAVVHVWCPQDGVRLLCLQNPHGTSEWTGR